MKTDPPVVFDVKVLDGAAIVNLLPSTGVSTFDDYATNIFIPYKKKQLDTSTQVDVVWDTYVTFSIKESTREKQGKGKWQKVAGKNKVLGNWVDFLHEFENKNSCFHFLQVN